MEWLELIKAPKTARHPRIYSLFPTIYSLHHSIELIKRILLGIRADTDSTWKRESKILSHQKQKRSGINYGKRLIHFLNEMDYTSGKWIWAGATSSRLPCCLVSEPHTTMGRIMGPPSCHWQRDNAHPHTSCGALVSHRGSHRTQCLKQTNCGLVTVCCGHTQKGSLA